MKKTFQYRIKDKNAAKHLEALARKVNGVWNYCGDCHQHAQRWNLRWPTGFDLINLTAGCTQELGLHADTIQDTCREYASRRKSAGKRLLRFRGKNSLGWIPFKRRSIQVSGDRFTYYGHTVRVWLSRPLEGQIKTGSFSQDARGHWYINLQCEVTAPTPVKTGKALGVDLGLRELATYHDGKTFTNIARERFYQDLQPALAEAQRSKMKKRTKRIHAKIANRRKDYLHKLSTELADQYQYIFVGDVSSAKLVKTKMAKSVLDAGWYMLKTFVETKAIARGSLYQLVNESYTTVTCSGCLERTGPSGTAGLGVKVWTCSDCQMTHDRNGNSAYLIRQRGLEKYVSDF